MPKRSKAPPFKLHRPDPPLPPDVHRINLGLVNAFLIGTAEHFVLIDAGLPAQAGLIRGAITRAFGPDARPAAVVLTHGHLDHIGSLRPLLKGWEKEGQTPPVYAHPLELPYLTGVSPYPPPDPSVGGGAMSATSPVFSPGPFKFRPYVWALPEGGQVPELPGWQVVFTPGHAPGHVSLYRPSDGTLIAGDAVVTVKQESASAIINSQITGRPELHGPPQYYTPNWDEARGSVQALAKLHIDTLLTGHGPPMRGPEVGRRLDDLAAHFDQQARPAHGRYVRQPAETNARGVRRLPPKPEVHSEAKPSRRPLYLALGGLAALLWLRYL